MSSMAACYAMKKRARKMAKGGSVETRRGQSEQGDIVRAVHHKKNAAGSSPAEAMDYARGIVANRMNNERKIEPNIKGMASGGEVWPPEDHEVMNEAAESEDDLIGKIMSSRENMYSEGGRVANGGDDDLDRMADGRPNEFDDLALRDDLEFSYDGANSGDKLGNAQEDEDRRDIVARVMRSRAKRDRMPRPT